MPDDSADGALPSITFVVAALNEERHIDACVESLLAQDYPPELVRIVVVDGGSADRTRDLVEARAAASSGRVELIDNPRRIAAAAFNIGIAAAETDLVAITSGHSETDPSFARVVAEAFAESGASLVGGRTVSVPAVSTPMADAIARAVSSPWGIGNSRHHYAEESGWVDTAYPSAYRRELLDEIGWFDESLVRNQDDDFHLRAAMAGRRMWMDPRLRAVYHPRSTITRLGRQYFEYGYWRARTLRKHGRVASPRQLAPAVLAAGVASGPVVGWHPLTRRLWVGGIVAYTAVLLAAAGRERAAGTGVRARVPAAVATLHLAYGAGFWVGALRTIGTSTHHGATAPDSSTAATT